MRLENSVKHDVLEERLRILIDDVTLSMYIAHHRHHRITLKTTTTNYYY